MIKNKDGGIQWLTNPLECCMATGYYWVQCTEYNNIQSSYYCGISIMTRNLQHSMWNSSGTGLTVHPSTNISQEVTEHLINLIYKRQKVLEQAKAALSLAAERMKWYYDQKVQSIPFKVGNKVLLSPKNYQTIVTIVWRIIWKII